MGKRRKQNDIHVLRSIQTNQAMTVRVCMNRARNHLVRLLNVCPSFFFSLHFADGICSIIHIMNENDFIAIIYNVFFEEIAARNH